MNLCNISGIAPPSPRPVQSPRSQSKSPPLPGRECLGGAGEGAGGEGPHGTPIAISQHPMIGTLKTYHLKRYKDIASLLIRHGRADLAQAIQVDENLPQDGSASTDAISGDPEQLARDLEKLGPTFIKLGQLLSTRSDLLPGPYLDALARLQDQIEPFSYEEVERIVSGELGVRLSKAFADFEPSPLAAASLAQVHRASMRDGRAVVVKIQRPDIRD